MSEQLNFDIHFRIFGDDRILGIIDGMTSGFAKVQAETKELDSGFQKTVKSMNNKIKTIQFSSILDQVDRVASGLESLAGPGLTFSSGLAELEAITGVTGTALDDLGDKARASALEFGGSATDSLNTYKTILSRLGPDIAKTPAALEQMERHVRTLSKTMGGDAKASVDALTSGMLQYGVDLSDPMEAAKEMERQMNIMAAGAQQGAVEVTGVAEGLVVSGTAAKQAKLSFAETNSALQLLTPKMKGASEAGTGLRNILGKMAGEDVVPKEAREKLAALGVDYSIVSDTSLSFTDRLRELKKAQSDATVLAQVFGTENAAAANILLDSVDAQEKLTSEIENTNTAREQADIIMESDAEKAERLRARQEDLKISLSTLTNGWLGYASVIGDSARDLANITPLFAGLGKVISFVSSKEKLMSIWTAAKNAALVISSAATKVVTGATWLWNAALNANPVFLIITGVAALGAGVYALTSALSSNTAEQEINNQVQEKAADLAADETAELNLLTEQLKRTKEGSEERARIMGELNDKYPEILSKYDQEKLSLEQINQMHKEIAASIMKKAEAEAAAEIYKEQVKKRMKAQAEGPGFLDTIIGMGTPGFTAEQFHAMDVAKEMQGEQAALNVLMGHKTREANEESASKETGIAPPNTPGANANEKSKLVGGSSSAKGEGKKTNSSIATGGTRNTTINLQVKSLIETFNVLGKNFKESSKEMERQSTDALLRTLAMANLAAE